MIGKHSAFNTICALTLSVCASYAAAADQGHGTVTFTGAIIDSPCSISPDSVDQTIDMGQVSVNAIKDGGSSTPRPFDIKLENCSVTSLSDKTVQATFTGAESTAVPGLLAIAGVASGAGIAMTNEGTPVVLGTPTAAQKISDGNNTLHYAAYLKGAATVVPGNFSAVTNFTLTYQ